MLVKLAIAVLVEHLREHVVSAANVTITVQVETDVRLVCVLAPVEQFRSRASLLRILFTAPPIWNTNIAAVFQHIGSIVLHPDLLLLVVAEFVDSWRLVLCDVEASVGLTFVSCHFFL